MYNIYHNSQNVNFRSPFGAVEKGVPTKLVVDAFSGEKTKAYIELKTIDVDNNITENSFEMLRTSDHSFETTLSNNTCGVTFYRFRFDIEGITLYYGNNEENLGGAGAVYKEPCDNYFQITVYENNLSVPEWFKKSIIYQIFPDRFARGMDKTAENKKNAFYYSDWNDLPFYIRKPNSNEIARWDFYRGNLSGVSEKLPYIEALGANLIYLNPIFSARSNHRYDTKDYMHVDGLLGGDPAFELLCYVAAKDNVHLMLDGVFSHTGADSIYFDKEQKYGTGAYKNKSSKYRSWYNFTSDDDEDYESWWGVKDLPNVNELDPGYIEYITDGDDSVIKHWIRKGIYGWRLDVADELPDEFLRHVRKAADEEGDYNEIEPVILGEVWEDASNKISYDKLRSYFTCKELHTVTNYPFRKNLLSFFRGELNGGNLNAKFMSLKENYPLHNFNALVNMTGTHDVKRLMTEALEISDGDKTLARNIIKTYAAIMFTFPGVPLVYYGDETCLEGDVDPDNRRTYPWGNEDINMITHFANLALARKMNVALNSGETYFLDAGKNAFSYIRTKGDNKILAVFHNKPSEYEKIFVSGLMRGSVWKNEKSEFTADENGVLCLNLKNYEILEFSGVKC